MYNDDDFEDYDGDYYDDDEDYYDEPEKCPNCGAELSNANPMVSPRFCRRCQPDGFLALLFLELFFFDGFPEKWW